MKILTIVGARPQFIKASVVSRALREKHHEVLLHTGQHFDHNMSDAFFEELDIPAPDYNLGISGGTHGKMTGEMLARIEEVLLTEKPDMALVYGDTNSTLAGALAAAKLHIPLCHVEAGARVGSLKNPEEINRICTDHISNLLFCCTESTVGFLLKEGIVDNVHMVGDPMYDAFLYYGSKADGNEAMSITGLDGQEHSIPDKYYYLTCHREENTASPDSLKQVLDAMSELDAKTIYPVHPRNRESVKEICRESSYNNIIAVMPVSYTESIYLVKNAIKVVTDSGGVQREAFFAGTPCLTVFDHVTWPETMVGNRNQLVKCDKYDILSKMQADIIVDNMYQPFGDGQAAKKILHHIDEFFKVR